MQLKKISAKLVLVLVIMLIPFNAAFALNLDEAKSQGLVGELQSGYLAAVEGKSSTAVNALVADINSKRKAEYQNIAKDTGTTLVVVETLAGKKAIEKTAEGNYVQSASGKLQKK